MIRKRDNTFTTKKYLSDSLLFLLEKKTYTDIQINEICEKAGVNRSTYYRNFSTKEDIVKHYYETLLLQFQTNNQRQELEPYLYAMFTYFYHYKHELMLLHKESLSYLFLDVLNRRFLDIEKNTSMQKSFKAYYHTGGIFNTFLLWFDQDMKLSPKEMTSYSLSVLPRNFVPFLSKKKHEKTEDASS